MDAIADSQNEQGNQNVAQDHSTLGDVYCLDPNPGAALARFSEKVMRICRTWRNNVRAIDADSLPADGKQRIRSVPSMVLVDEQMLSPEELRHEANAEALLNITRALIDLIDMLLGMKSLEGKEFLLDPNLKSEAEIQEYFEKVLSDHVRAVAANVSLKNPAKLQQLGVVENKMAQTILTYFDLRQVLEHHKRVVARKDIAVQWSRVAW